MKHLTIFPCNANRCLAAFTCAALTIGILIFTPIVQAAFVPFVDDFSGTALNTADWGVYTPNVRASASIGDGRLSAGTTDTGASQRTTIFSTRSDFDPFDQALTITLTGLTLSGTTSSATSYNTFYVMIGNTNATEDSPPSGGNLYPSTTPASGNGYFALLIRKLSDDTLQLIVRERTASRIVYTLSAIPTTLSWSLSGTSWSLDLTGATLSNDTQGSGLTSVSGNFTNTTASMFANGSWLALGALNEGANVTTGTSITLDSISVTAIPEPANAALWMIGLAGLAFLARRRAFGKRP